MTIYSILILWFFITLPLTLHNIFSNKLLAHNILEPYYSRQAATLSLQVVVLSILFFFNEFFVISLLLFVLSSPLTIIFYWKAYKENKQLKNNE